MEPLPLEALLLTSLLLAPMGKGFFLPDDDLNLKAAKLEHPTQLESRPKTPEPNDEVALWCSPRPAAPTTVVALVINEAVVVDDEQGRNRNRESLVLVVIPNLVIIIFSCPCTWCTCMPLVLVPPTSTFFMLLLFYSILLLLRFAPCPAAPTTRMPKPMRSECE
jgi:hypothetical protein